MSRRKVMMSNTGDWIDQFKVNEDLAIKSAEFTSSQVVVSRKLTLNVIPENLEILESSIIQTLIIIDHLTGIPIELTDFGVFSSVVVCKFVALAPKGQRYFTAYLQDINGCISPNGVTVSIRYR